jgi:serine protease AprX
MADEENSNAPSTELPQSDPKRKPFVPEDLDRTVIAIPLLKRFQDEKIARDKDPSMAPELHKVIIDLNLEFPGGREEARTWVVETTRKIVAELGDNKNPNVHGINTERSALTPQYLFGSLEGDVIRELVSRDEAENGARSTDSASSTRAIFHIWPDFEIRALTTKSVSTVKADAARASFAALGDDIVWAVMDSGIDVGHRHLGTDVSPTTRRATNRRFRWSG